MNGFYARQVSLSRRGQQVLDGVDICIKPGEMVALVGPNGVGKSTLLRIMAGEVRPDSGCCRVDGLDVHRDRGSAIARRRAVLPQDAAAPFPMRVADVVAMGRAPWRRHATPRQNRRATSSAATAAGITGLMERDYRQLSGGERQRVQLARVLAQIQDARDDSQPCYLLLDEPASGLDIGHQQRLMGIVRSVVSGGVGVLAVLHDLNLACTFAERICLLADGQVAADGTPAEVINAATISAVYNAQVTVEIDTRTGRPLVLPP